MTFLEQILLTIVTASATAVLAYFGFWRQAKAELQKEYESRYNERKWEVYLNLINNVPILIRLNGLVNKFNSHNISEVEKIEMENLEKIYDEADSKIIHQIFLIGSKEVVKAFLAWKDHAELIDVKDENTIELFINLLNVMREDLGQGKSNIATIDLYGSYFFSTRITNQIIEKEIEIINKHIPSN